MNWTTESFIIAQKIFLNLFTPAALRRFDVQ